MKGQAWEDTSVELHYKLSMKISSSFTRELLEINYNYSNHEECIRQNDKTPRNEKPEMKLIPLSSIYIIYIIRIINIIKSFPFEWSRNGRCNRYKYIWLWWFTELYSI